jgi:hypothetical protein
VLLAAALLAGCGSDNKVTIRGTFTEPAEGMVYLDQSEVDRSNQGGFGRNKEGTF